MSQWFKALPHHLFMTRQDNGVFAEVNPHHLKETTSHNKPTRNHDLKNHPSTNTGPEQTMFSLPLRRPRSGTLL